MVLITASTVSAVLSAGIVSVFTFLLFLAGYVLQQQSVNALRDAIRQPPPTPPKAILPPRFRTDVEEDQEVTAIDGNETKINDQIAQFLAQDGPSDARNIISTPEQAGNPTSQDTFAYILALSKPSDLCSAALLAQTLDLTLSSPDRLVLLYPSTWETSLTSQHISALTFMRSLHDLHPIIFHPVEFVKGWEKAATTSHLLGELQRTPWDFNRMLYLKTPGMVVDAESLRNALWASSAKKMWTPMTKAVGDDPDVLMWERRRGLLMPRGGMRGLAGRENASGDSGAPGITQEAHGGVEPRLQETTYMLFGTEEERDGKSELLLKFETGLNSVCAGKGLLKGEEERVELRK